MAIKTLKFEVVGTSPLIMHSTQGMNPRNEITQAMKAITEVKGPKRTEAQTLELYRLEWFAGLYQDEQGRPCVPGELIEGMIRDAARKKNKGKLVTAGVVSDGNWPVIYDGPKKVEDLYADNRFVDFRTVVIQRKRIMRTRPIFRQWGLKFEVAVFDDVITPSSVEEFVAEGGRYVGLGDYRPKFGKFEVK